ncbi:MAG: tyrosine-type recombinase/integrase [Armatimonadota bacterium]
MRLGHYLDQWFNTEAKLRCRPRELRRREQLIRLHIKLRLGHIPIAKLAPATLEDFFAGLKTRSAHHIFKVLRAALNHAVRLDLILANPCDRVTAPRPAVFRPTLWTVEETLRFLEECHRSSPKNVPFFLTAVATGARLGELQGLRWRDVDLDAGVIRITQQLERPAGGGFRFADPKSPRSRRPIRLPQEIMIELRTLRRRQIETRLKSGLCPQPVCLAQYCPYWHDFDLVFCQPNGKPGHGHNLAQRLMGQIMKRAGVPRIRFHDLRHAHGTLLAASGVNLKVITERMGHSTEAFTLTRYIHATPDMQQEAASAVSRRLFSNQSLINPGAVDGVIRLEQNGQEARPV